MAIYHFEAKPIRRALGHSVTAAAAYAARSQITDERTGEVHNYSKKPGLVSAQLVLPPGAGAWASNRADLWNAAEVAEKRKDACVGRQIILALPAELNDQQRERLALDFARSMAEAEGCAVDVAVHAPDAGTDQRNHHAHLIRSTRRVGLDGMGAKLASEQAGRDRKKDLADLRERWATMANTALERAGEGVRIDHRSNAARGLDAVPTIHVGRYANAPERRQHNAEVKAVNHELADARAELAKVAKPTPRRRASALSQADIEAARQDSSTRLAAAKKTVDQEEMEQFRRGLKAALFVEKVAPPPLPEAEQPPPLPDEPGDDSLQKKLRPK